MSDEPKITAVMHRTYADELIDRVLAGEVPESVLVTNKEYPNGIVMTRTEYFTRMIRSMGGEKSPRFEEAMAKLAALDREMDRRVHEANEAFMRAQQQLPSKMQMGKNVIGAIGRTGMQIITGSQVKADPAEIERRRKICAGDPAASVPHCEAFIIQDERCAKCGCFTNLKTWLHAEHCPLKKW